MHTGACKYVLLIYTYVYGKVGKQYTGMMPNLSLCDMTTLLYVAAVLRSIKASLLARPLCHLCRC